MTPDLMEEGARRVGAAQAPAPWARPNPAAAPQAFPAWPCPARWTWPMAASSTWKTST